MPLKNYGKYQMGATDWIYCTAKATVISAAIAWLFYRNFRGLLIMPIVWALFFWQQKKEGGKKQRQRLRSQFKECIRIVTGLLYSGYSIENAFKEAERELCQLWGKQAEMCRELCIINQHIKLNIPVEALLQNLAERSGVEEILGFGQVFSFAKRSGSDFARILKDTAERIGEKADLERELETLVAARQLEQKIMNVIPLGILFFVDITSPGFLGIMYSSSLGRVFMSVCLLLYGGAYLLSGKIVDIRI